MTVCVHIMANLRHSCNFHALDTRVISVSVTVGNPSHPHVT